MQRVSVTIRRDRETKRPVLFFVNENPDGWWLDCYEHVGQHSQASRGYMRRCEPLRQLDAESLALLREWSQLGEPCDARPVARLTYPRNLPYIGA